MREICKHDMRTTKKFEAKVRTTAAVAVAAPMTTTFTLVILLTHSPYIIISTFNNNQCSVCSQTHIKPDSHSNSLTIHSKVFVIDVHCFVFQFGEIGFADDGGASHSFLPVQRQTLLKKF